MVIEVLAKIDVSNRKNHAQKKQFSIQKLRTGQLKGLESTNSFLSIWNYVRVFWCKLKDISIVFLELFNDWSSRLRLASVLVSLIIFMIFRLRINGENSLYQWTKMENHIHLLPNFFHRSLSYAQMHFWYLFKLIYPRHLCFDYGYSCIPIVTTMVDCRNLMPLSMYLTIGIMFTYGVATADTIVLFSLSILLIALVPTLQILFPVGTLLAERLLFVPSIGFCMLSGYFAVSKMSEFWIAADDSICAAINYFAAKYTEKLERTRSTTSKATIEVFDNAHITETTPRTSPAQKKKVTFSENKKEKSKMTVNRIVLPDIVSSEQQKPFILKQLPLSSKYFALAILVSLLSFRVVTRNGDWQSEYGLYSSALQVCPLSVKALTNFAVLASSNKSEENLRNVVLPAAIAGVSIHSRNVATLINAGVAYDNLGEYSRSIHLFQRALKEVPSHSKALAYLGTSEYRWSLIVEDKIARSLLKVQAIQHLESSIANGWSYPSSLHMLGSAYLEINEILKGISYLEEALKVSSYNKDMRRGSSDVPVADDINWACTYNQLGNAYRAAGDMEAAIKSFHLGLRIQPDVYQIHTNLGSLYREMGRIDEARRVLEEGIRITIPKTPAALSNNLGLLELDEGNLQRAWDLFSSALNNAGIGYDSSVLPDSPGADESIQSIILNNLEKVKSAMNSRR